MAKIGINIATASLQKPEIVVGLSMGATNNFIAVIHPGTSEPILLREHDGSTCVPAIIHFNGDKAVTVGEAAKKFLAGDPSNTIVAPKRMLGKSMQELSQYINYFTYKIVEDSDNSVKVSVADRFYTPVQLTAFILKELKSRAEHILKTKVYKTVIAVPVHFNEKQRQAVQDAGKMAGLDVLGLLNDPVAACLAYGFGIDPNDTKTIVVYDLGGSTFDVSLLRIINGSFGVLASQGDNFFGGVDFDRAIVTYWINRPEVFEKHLKDPVFAQLLQTKAAEARKHLDKNDSFSVVCEGVNLNLAKSELEELSKPLIDKTIQACISALADAKLGAAEIDEVILAGNAACMPAVRHAVSAFFGKNVKDSISPGQVIAMGAAIEASTLAGG